MALRTQWPIRTHWYDLPLVFSHQNGHLHSGKPSGRRGHRCGPGQREIRTQSKLISLAPVRKSVLSASSKTCAKSGLKAFALRQLDSLCVRSKAFALLHWPENLHLKPTRTVLSAPARHPSLSAGSKACACGSPEPPLRRAPADRPPCRRWSYRYHRSPVVWCWRYS